jgi:hypothetical protein
MNHDGKSVTTTQPYQAGPVQKLKKGINIAIFIFIGIRV